MTSRQAQVPCLCVLGLALTTGKAACSPWKGQPVLLQVGTWMTSLWPGFRRIMPPHSPFPGWGPLWSHLVLGLPVGPGPMSFPLKPFLLLSDETGKVIATKFFDMYEGGKKTCSIKIKAKLCRPHRERETEGFFFSFWSVFIDCRFCCISEHHAPGHQFWGLTFYL